MFKTEDGELIDVEELTWDSARFILKEIQPELVEVIDQLGPGPEFTLYKANYPFGSKIIHKTEVYLPLANGDGISFNDPKLPKTLIEHLSYDLAISNPFGINLNKSSEFHLPIGQRIMPYLVVAPGEVFGLAKILDNVTRNIPLPSSPSPSFMWELKAGARSIFMLPRISETNSHNKLKKAYSLSSEKPDSYVDHWAIFKELAKKAQSPWRAEVLYFSNKWAEKLKDSAWVSLYNLFWRIHRSSYRIWHNSTLMWTTTFNQVEQLKYLSNFTPCTLDTAKHLFTIAANSAPGFKPATDETSAPINLIQKAYQNGYGLTDYWPIVMEPAQISSAKATPLYYSLNHPTLAQWSPETSKGKSLIVLLEELQRVVEKYQSGIIECDFPVKAPSLLQAASNTNFSYYHSDPADYPLIKNVNFLAEEDTRFTYNQHGSFPAYSQFLKGCVKISLR